LCVLGCELSGGRCAGSFDAQSLGGRAQGIALTLDLFDHDKMLALERAQCIGGQRHLAFDIGGGERAAVEQPQDLHDGVFRSGVEQKLARSIAPGVSERINLPAADVGSER
jgi:hypothetical protein